MSAWILEAVVSRVLVFALINALSELLYGHTSVNSQGPAAGTVAYLPRYEICFVPYILPESPDRHYVCHNGS